MVGRRGREDVPMIGRSEFGCRSRCRDRIYNSYLRFSLIAAVANHVGTGKVDHPETHARPIRVIVIAASYRLLSPGVRQQGYSGYRWPCPRARIVQYMNAEGAWQGLLKIMGSIQRKIMRNLFAPLRGAQTF
jgi:hypothetical protein